MRPTLPFRLTALAMALLGSFSVPAMALAHGHVHEHLAQAHEGDHGDDHGIRRHSVADGVLSVEGASSDDHAHGHPLIDLAARAHDLRLSSAPVIVAIVPAPLAIRATLDEVRAPARTDSVLLARPGPERGPPPTLRAPPNR